MPSSRACTIPYVISVIRQIKPDSILDVGVGFGKWGYLFREYTDVLASENDPPRYAKPGWKTRIEGIEGFPAYLHDGHKFIYDKIHQGNAAELLPKLGRFDLIFLGDIIEHFPLEDGKRLLRQAISQADECVMLTTPRFETHQEDLCGNELERHRSLWRQRDFRQVGPCKISLADHATLVVAYLKEGCQHVWLRPQPSGAARFAYRAASKVRRTLGKFGRRSRDRGQAGPEDFQSADFWENRYKKGGNSGLGSYGKLALFKAEFINGFIREYKVKRLLDFGCGDGNQASFLQVENYLGVDVSPSAVQRCREKFKDDPHRRFLLYNQASFREEAAAFQADLAISMDVVFDLVEDEVYVKYMDDLFNAGTRHVIIYSTNFDRRGPSLHHADRQFTAYLERQMPDWELIQTLVNPYKGKEVQADFFVYARTQARRPSRPPLA